MRLSAMGDVALLLPVLYAVAEANPEHEFTLLTQPFLANLLIASPSNVEAMVIETKGEERNFWGLCRYVERLRDEHFDLCLDLHDVLRTKFLRWGLCFGGVRTWVVDKQRRARRKLIRGQGSEGFEPLMPMWQAYQEVFRRAGLSVPQRLSTMQVDESILSAELSSFYPEAFDPRQQVVGIAPFASTESKTYPPALMERVVIDLSGRGIVVYLFGGGERETRQLATWAETYPNVRLVAGQLELADELRLMQHLDLMLSMDSANAHLAAMLACPVLSIWCATHPAGGFAALGQSPDDCLQDDKLSCRPCTIFGKVYYCPKGDMPCRHSLSPQLIAEHVVAKLRDLSVV